MRATLTNKDDPKEAYLNPDTSSNISAKIEIEMKVKKKYLRRGYGLKDLSRDSDIHLYLVSAYLNQEKGLRFNDFVNEYRIATCKEFIREGSALQITLAGLAAMCGFNNRNTFTTAFKKFTGVTPSEYIRNVSS